jgi:hypothetical protein
MAPFAERWRALRHRHPVVTPVLLAASILLVAVDLYLVGKRVTYARETARLREGMTAAERARIDAAMESDSNRLQVMIELAKRQARVDAALHLSVAVDSGVLRLEQDGAVLRSVPAEIGRDGWLRTGPRDSVRITAPRGARTIARVLDDSVIVLSGGARIYARAPADTTVARAGTVRVDASDFKAIRPSLRAGQRVYFF